MLISVLLFEIDRPSLIIDITQFYDRSIEY